MEALTKRHYARRDKGAVSFATQLSEKQKARWIETGRLLQTELGLEKRCGKCGEYWPFDNEFFYSQKSHCIACFAVWRDEKRGISASVTDNEH